MRDFCLKQKVFGPAKDIGIGDLETPRAGRMAHDWFVAFTKVNTDFTKTTRVDQISDFADGDQNR